MVEPVHPFEGCVFHGFKAVPRAAAVDDLGFEEAIDRLRQGVVATVPDAADRGLMPASASRSVYFIDRYCDPVARQRFVFKP